MGDNRTLGQKMRGEPDTSNMTRLRAAMTTGQKLPPLKQSEKNGKDSDKKK